MTAPRSWSPLSGQVARARAHVDQRRAQVAAGDGFDAGALVKGADDGSADRRLAAGEVVLGRGRRV